LLITHYVTNKNKGSPFKDAMGKKGGLRHIGKKLKICYLFYLEIRQEGVAYG